MMPEKKKLSGTPGVHDAQHTESWQVHGSHKRASLSMHASAGSSALLGKWRFALEGCSELDSVHS